MKPKWKIGALFLSVLVLTFWQGCAYADKRVALIIGNSAYVRANKLINPENDAKDLADALRKLNFEVILKTNLDKRGLDGALEEFERKIQSADTAMFFFAGHGLQYRGRNFLLPTDANLEDEVSLRYNTLAIDDVRDALSAASGVKILILDACRDNPLAKTLLSRSTANSRSFGFTRGLARLDRADGMVIAYATQADQVAQDGSGRNSPFSSALVRRLLEPNLEIATLFRRVAQDVYEQTGGRQRPELSISLLQDFYLNLQDDDLRAWRRLGPNAAKAELSAFIEKFPNSPLARDARNRLYAQEIIRQEEEQRDGLRKDAERNEACAREAEQINRMAGDKKKIDLERLKPSITCPGLVASIDAWLNAIADEDRLCGDENRMLQRLGPEDLGSLKAFVGRSRCAAARKTAGERVASLEAEMAKQQSAALEQKNLDKVRSRLAAIEAAAQQERQRAACQSEAQRLAAIRSGSARPQLRAQLRELQGQLTCASVKAEAAGAIEEIAGLEQKNLDKVRARLAAIEAESRNAESQAAKQKAACQAEGEKLAALKSAHTALQLRQSDLKEFQAHLTCVSLRDDVAKAVDAIGAEEQQNLDRVKARLAAIEAENRKAEGESADQKGAACQAEAQHLAAIKSRPAPPPLRHSELTELQTHLTCISLRADVAKAIKDLTPALSRRPE
jgi:hypothetical protein